MSCTISDGRDEPCKDVVGGIKNVYMLSFKDAGLVPTRASGAEEITDFGADDTWYKYEIKGASSFTQNIQSNRDNGTTFFEQVVELTFKKLTYQDHDRVYKIAAGRPHVAIEDYNGNFFLVGEEHGCDATGGTIVSGAVMGDLTGYTLTLTGMERRPANFVTGSGITKITA
tara:strand:- start:3313 stop:3825 length:513 start_codon:yes stop_codon:yes gene_type:complete